MGYLNQRQAKIVDSNNLDLPVRPLLGLNFFAHQCHLLVYYMKNRGNLSLQSLPARAKKVEDEVCDDHHK